jgi:hypothetical protein
MSTYLRRRHDRITCSCRIHHRSPPPLPLWADWEVLEARLLFRVFSEPAESLKIQQVNKRRPVTSLLSRNVAGAPMTASVFSRMPMDLEAITSQSELQASNSFLDQNDLNGLLVATTDRSKVSQEMVRKLSARNLSRQNSGRQPSRTVGNATWGAEPSRNGAFRTSGILPKNASESHLLRTGGLILSKSRPGSLSRENNLYNLMKKNSSKNLIRRDDSQGSLLASKRRVGSKHKLTLSRSVPALIANNGGFMPHGSQNAVW